MKSFKRIFAIVLTFALVITAFSVSSPSKVEAASKTYTFVKGEVMTFNTYSNVKSVSSSNSKVCKVSKDEDNSTYFIVAAKKTGNATIKVKSESGTTTYKIKVVANDIEVECKAITADGDVIYKVTNNTDVYFSILKVSYTLKDSDGDELESGTFSVYDLPAGASAFKEVSYSYRRYTASLKKSTAKVNLKESSRNALSSTTYTNKSKKVKVTVTDSEGDGYVSLKVKFKNTYSDRVYAVADVILYDSDNNIIGVKTASTSVVGKGTSTDTYKYYLYNVEYDHYKVVSRAYCTTYSY